MQLIKHGLVGEFPKGGFRTVETVEERNAIPVDNRDNLMKVAVNDTETTYQLRIPGYKNLSPEAKLSALGNNAFWFEEGINFIDGGYSNSTYIN